jgi:hypothetical protein
MLVIVLSATTAPDVPGAIALVAATPGEPDAVVWAEPTPNVRTRLAELAHASVEREPALARVLARCNLRVRYATMPDMVRLERVMAILWDRLEHVPPPGST